MKKESSTAVPEALIKALRESNKITVLTGSGISAESNIPTFREAQTGLWAQYNPQELATREAFQNNPRLVWDWYSWRRELIASAKPNLAHKILVKIENTVTFFTLVTQNIDGLHQSAGSKNIIELHGNIFRTKCFEEDRIIEQWEDQDELPPLCPHCGGLLRPDVVWSGESLNPQDLTTAAHAAQNCDILFSVGTSSIVEPAASLPYLTRQEGGILVEINPHKTPLTGVADYSLRAPAGTILPDLVRQTWC